MHWCNNHWTAMETCRPTPMSIFLFLHVLLEQTCNIKKPGVHAKRKLCAITYVDITRPLIGPAMLSATELLVTQLLGSMEWTHW